ncbi:MAG: T9SS type A sorting domain-containing protein, partial [Bacteroidota bacterium]
HNADLGKAYYRLKLVDNDSKVEYSRIIVLNVACGKASILVYPNPAKDFINVNINGADNKGTVAILVSSAGQVVMNKNLQNGTNQLDVSRLASGVYNLRLMNSSGTQNIKVVID